MYRGYHSFSAVVICYCLLCWKVATLLSEEITICIVKGSCVDLPPITVFGNTHAQKLKLKRLSKRRYFTCLEYRGTFLLNFLCTAMGPSGAGTLRAGGHLQCWHSDPPFYLHLNPPGPHQPSTPPSLVAAACKTPHCAHVPGSAGNPTCKKVEGEWGALMIFLRSSAIAIFPNIIFMMLSFRLLLWRGLPDISGHRHWWTFPALIDQWLIQLLCHKALSVHKMDKI